jgi:hypothetical protein
VLWILSFCIHVFNFSFACYFMATMLVDDNNRFVVSVKIMHCDRSATTTWHSCRQWYWKRDSSRHIPLMIQWLNKNSPYLRRFKWVLCWKNNFNLESTLVIWSIFLKIRKLFFLLFFLYETWTINNVMMIVRTEILALTEIPCKHKLDFVIP